MSKLLFKSASVVLLLFVNNLAYAQQADAWQTEGSARFSLSSFEKSEVQDVTYEAGLFVDAIYLDRSGVALGYIRQDQGLSNRDDIVNDILYLNGWHSWFPEMLPGKVSVALNYYHGSESTRGSSGGNSPGNPDPGNTDPGNPDPGNPNSGAGKPTPRTVTSFTDSLTIINPVLSYMNYAKTLYLDIGYATSEYDTSNTTAGNLEVSQWSPAIGIGVNDQYDWLQLRLFDTDLSSDARTPGVNNTQSASISWTHWLRTARFFSMNHFNVSLLLGERLYAVDHDVRKIYNLTDMQTGSVVAGANWKMDGRVNLHVYGGYEKFEDVSNQDKYNSLFVYAGISKQW